MYVSSKYSCSAFLDNRFAGSVFQKLDLSRL